ncbi:MAG: cobalt ECF transporter T component CbiQ [Hominilimicola sp.]
MKHKEKNVYSIDTIAYNSKIKHWNSEFKMMFALFSLTACIVSGNIFVSLFVIAAMAVISIGIGGVNCGRYLKLMTIPFTFIILGTVAIAAGFVKEPVGQYNLNLKFFYIYTTNVEIFKALKAALKALGSVSSLYMMTLSTPVNEIVSAMRKIHIPKLIIELMNMIYRFIFILAEVQHSIKTSAKSRLGYCDFKTSCYTFGISAASLLIISLKKANAYYDAMESRCYTGELLFLEEEKPIRKNQIIIGVIYFVCMGAVMFFVR